MRGVCALVFGIVGAVCAIYALFALHAPMPAASTAVAPSWDEPQPAPEGELAAPSVPAALTTRTGSTEAVAAAPTPPTSAETSRATSALMSLAWSSIEAGE